ncbi:unnamed protein product, partial [Aphanomyces euteiches]
WTLFQLHRQNALRGKMIAPTGIRRTRNSWRWRNRSICESSVVNNLTSNAKRLSCESRNT